MQYLSDSSRKSAGWLKQLLITLPVFTSVLITCSLWAQSTVSMRSPDGHISLVLTAGNHEVRYAAHYQDQVLTEGNIGFAFDQDGKYGAEIQSFRQLSDVHQQKHALETRGNHTSAQILKNEYHLKVISEDGHKDFWLDFDLYNNGIAYRYRVLTGGRTLEKALSRVSLPPSARIWWQSDVHTYEGNYQSALYQALGDSLALGMPLTIQYSNGLYAALTEADIFGFVGSYFSYYQNNKTLDYTLAGPVRPENEDTLHSGWQILMVAKDLNGLVNNDIIRDLSATPDRRLYPQGLKTSWIHPGISLWTWMSKKRDVTPENIRRFTDYASAMHFPYNLIDDGWVKWKADGKDHWQILKEQVAYAKSKGVGIWVWQAYPPHNGTPGLMDTAYMRSFFQKCAALGVRGMKIDFINAETQDKIAFYKRAASLAAYYHLMVDFHGADKGTGMEYRFPNVLSQEGVRGLEQKDNLHWPYLNTVLPFTRYLSGPADYTPVSFEPYVSSTTLAHQVATAAVFTSPFLCLGADPGTLSQRIALPLLQQLPATWDETIVLPVSKIGALAVFARRKGHTWYLAVLNGNLPQSIKIDASFLGKGKYHLQALEDKLNTRGSQLTKTDKIKKGSQLSVALPAGGGYLGIFKK